MFESGEIFYVLKVANDRKEKSIELIQKEAKAMEEMEDDGRQFKLIESVFDSQLKPNELPWLLMDYIPGITLNDLLESIRGSGNTPLYELKPILKYKIIYAIAKELCFFHDHGLVHRDIKPDNIYIDHQFIPHIGDLGDSSNHSVTTVQHGSINFIPPESIVKPGELIECPPSYDVYEFGGTLLQILTYEWPYSNIVDEDKKPDRDEIEKRIKNGEIDDRFEPGGELDDQLLPEDSDLYEIVKKCWSYNPSDRPTMNEILDMIKESAENHLNDDENQQFDVYINETLEEQSINIPLGHKDNIKQAIENGFHLLLDETSPLRYAAEFIGIDPKQYKDSVTDALQDTLYRSERSNPHLSR